MPLQNKAAERWPMIEILSRLGWGSGPIAQTIGWSQQTVIVDLKKKGGTTKLFPGRPAGAYAVYEATFLFFAKYPDLENPLRSGIWRFLQMNLLEAFSHGMNHAHEVLCQPTCSSELKPYVNLLWNVVFPRMSEPLHPLENYLSMVRTGEVDPPKSYEAALAGMIRLFHQSADRDNLMIRTTDDLREGVDEWLSTIPKREEKILISSWGLQGQPEQTLDAIAAELGITRERVRQLEIATLKKLRSASMREKLRPFFLTMSEMHEDLAKAREKLAKVEDFIRSGKSVEYIQDQGARTYLLEQLHRRCEDLELSVRSANCLQNTQLTYVWQLCQKSEAELLKTKNFGRKSLIEIKDILSDMGLRLGMEFVPLLGDDAPH